MDNLLPVVLSICCGIDVHKKTLTACLLTTGASGEAVHQVRILRTVTGQLQELAGWLVQAGCRQVALESTGVYWKPVFNVLEQAGLEVGALAAQLCAAQGDPGAARLDALPYAGRRPARPRV
jgi:transposase